MLSLALLGGVDLFLSRFSKSTNVRGGSAEQAASLQTVGGIPISATAPKVRITLLEEGSGSFVEEGDSVLAHYILNRADNTLVESTWKRGDPVWVTLGNDAAFPIGFHQGVFGMKIGERRIIDVPSELGYGSAGIKGLIAPNTALRYEVQILNINKAKARDWRDNP